MNYSEKNVRVAVVQAFPITMNEYATLEKALGLSSEAVEKEWG